MVFGAADMEGPLLTLVARRRLVLVVGKGGVGKTTVAAALAVKEAARGRRVRIVSTDPAHSLGHLFDLSIGDPGRALGPRLFLTELDPDDVAARHLATAGRALRRMMPAHLHGEVDRQLELARDAPGHHEAALLERLAELVEAHLSKTPTHDLLILDTAPSGHTLRLLGLPGSMSGWVRRLLTRRRHARRLRDAFLRLGPDPVAQKAMGDREREDELVAKLEERERRLEALRVGLRSSATTSAVLVLTRGRLPLAESLELFQKLEAQSIEVGSFVVNRCARDAGPYEEAAHGLALRRAAARVPIVEVPLLDEEPLGKEALAKIDLTGGSVAARG